MIEQVVSNGNLNKAYLKVYRNKGAGGVDGLQVEDLKPTLSSHGAKYLDQIREGGYQPSPIMGVEIPKSNGKTRLLGIPTVVDRVFQQALYQVLEPVFEPCFQQHNYGFRPCRSAHDAVLQGLSNINDGHKHVVDIDLKSFFDQVDHTLLLELIRKKVTCRRTLKLLRSFLKAPIYKNGRLHKRTKGVPQGSPLSPLLSNILLNELDIELENRGHKYVRYADDFSIYVKSKMAARRVIISIEKYLLSKLKLPVNPTKSGIRTPSRFKLLGYSFVSTYKRGDKGKYQLVAEKSSWMSFKQKLKRLTRKTNPMSFDERIRKLNWVIRGWVNYFKLGSIHAKLKKLDEWLRNRLRYCIWHHWKKRRRKEINLIRLGLDPIQARKWSYTRMGGWRVAQSPILRTTITVDRLTKRGLTCLTQYYQKVKYL